MLTAFIAGCAAATGGGTEGNAIPAGGDSAPPPASAPTNTAPVTDGGTDITIELPTDSATLSGSATDDGLRARPGRTPIKGSTGSPICSRKPTRRI